jgi:hypothetical protein
MRLLVVRTAADGESEAAARWSTQQAWETATTALDGAVPDLRKVDAIWIHSDTVPQLSPDVAARLRGWTEEGGGLVLSLLATAVASALGAGGPSPQLEGPVPWSDDDDPLWTPAFRSWPQYPHIRGLQGWGRHPLFEGLSRGAYTWAATQGEVVSGAVFRKPDWPDDHARVIAVERSYVHLGADVGVAWEYDVGEGRLLCLGSHLRFTAPDERFVPHRDTVIRNALVDAARLKTSQGPAAPRPCWPDARRRHAPVSVLPRTRPRAATAAGALLQPSISIGNPDASAFTLAGARALVAGTESAGMSEIWLHPLCALSDVDLQIGGAPVRCNAMKASPGEVRRDLTSADDAGFREWIVVHPDLPEAHYQLERVAAVAGSLPVIEMRVRLPLRLEWPFPPDALVPLRVEVAGTEDNHVIAVTGRDGEHLSLLFISGTERPEVLSEDDEGAMIRLRSSDPRGIRFTLTATTGARSGLPTPGSLAEAHDAQQHRLADLKQRTAAVDTGDPVVDAAWPWAIARLSNFMAEGLDGRGLMAGYAASRPGWGRSRPGYAWFFGRDTCWTVDAMLAVGMHAEARNAIGLLVHTADITGKIAHEITTSGVVHYDAADATPLLLRAIAAWAEWTGELDQVRSWWPSVRRAVEFCVACDRDGDGLPENKRVGHGWVESGALGGGAVTSTRHRSGLTPSTGCTGRRG